MRYVVGSWRSLAAASAIARRSSAFSAPTQRRPGRAEAIHEARRPASSAGCSSGASVNARRTFSRVTFAGGEKDTGRSALESNPSCSSS